MLPMPKWATIPLLAAAVFSRGVLSATALSVTPSTSWYGDDGAWSALSLRVGSPPQWVDVMVCTASAETWVVGTGGCDGNSLCSTLRGGVFNSSSSSTWASLGYYDLGLDSQLGFGGYGYYGFDDLTFGTTGVVLPSTIIASFNTSEYWLGYLGVGIVPGNFTTVTALSPISALVESEGAISSHSYGYTAGAAYQLKGEPCSLTLGGYDANRFVPHNITFELNPSQQPETYVNGITVVSSIISGNSSSNSSGNWSTPVPLLNPSDRVYATIDSSTPYLWLPESVCDRFAESLGLSYNDSLDLYTFDSNEAQRNVLFNAQLTFTFSLSDFSGANASEIVNITLPYSAFDLQLTYPAIPNTTYNTPDSSKHYFPLRRASSSAQYTIGRSFLQEAYLITDYERNTFSVHQAVHTADPIGNTSIVAIERPSNSTFSGPSSAVAKPNGLSKGAIAGIVVGSVAFVILFSLIIFLFCRRRKYIDEKGTGPPVLSFLKRPARPAGLPSSQEVNEGSLNHLEYDARSTNARHELLLPPRPMDLNSESNTLGGTTEAGTSSRDYPGLSAYEQARRKLEHQQQSTSQPPSPFTPQNPYHVGINESDMSLTSQRQLSHSSGVDSQQASSGDLGPRIPLTINTVPPSATQNVRPGPVSPILPPYHQAGAGQDSHIAPSFDAVDHAQTLQTAAGSARGRVGGHPGISAQQQTHNPERGEDLYGDGDTVESASRISSEYGSFTATENHAQGQQHLEHQEFDNTKFLREDIQNLRAGMKNSHGYDQGAAPSRIHED